jgi:beta-glucanase (GH16 family)
MLQNQSVWLQTFIIVIVTIIHKSQVISKPTCFKSLTTVFGTKAPANFCSGELLFFDDFNELDESNWLVENSMGIGGKSKEFQWYVNDPKNVFTTDGILHMKPSITADLYGESFLYSGHVKIENCTQNIFSGCEKTGNKTHIINPVRSVRMNTMKSFSFKYGTLEIRAKMPSGDWLFPALWLNV